MNKIKLPKITKGQMRLRRADGKTYLERRRISTPWFRVFLHKMEAPDPGQHLHDHPWPFRSLILWGGYTEEQDDTRVAADRAWHADFSKSGIIRHGDEKTYGLFQWNRMPLNKCHRIISLNRKTCWTLVFAGKRVRDWGFYPPEGWIYHEDYDSKVHRGDLYVEGDDGDG